MKKLALLMALVLVFSVSCVLATDTANDAAPLILAAPVSGEVSGELVNDDVTTGEVVSGDVASGEVITSGETAETETEDVSGEVSDVTNPTDTEVNDTEDEHEHDHNHETNNSAIVGAIIAIVIVVAVVAIAAILRKD